MVACYAHSRHVLFIIDGMAGRDLQSQRAASANRCGLHSLALALTRRRGETSKALCRSTVDGAGLNARVVTHSTAKQGVHTREASNFMGQARDALAWPATAYPLLP